MENREVARILRETAQLLEIDGAMIGRYRSYERAAELLDSLPESIEELAKDREKLMELPGHRRRHGRSHRGNSEDRRLFPARQSSSKNTRKPFSICSICSRSGRRKSRFSGRLQGGHAWRRWKQLAREGKLRDLPGFGEKSEENILKAIEVFKKSAGRFHIDVAEEEAEMLVAHIRAFGKPIEAVTPAGSLRRGKETVGDLDLLVTLPSGKYTPKTVEAIAEHILEIPGNRSDAGARRKQSQLRSEKRTAGGRADSGKGKFLARRCSISRDRRSTTSRCAAAPTRWATR